MASDREDGQARTVVQPKEGPAQAADGSASANDGGSSVAHRSGSPRDAGRLRGARSTVWRRVPPGLRLPLVVYLITQVIYLFWWIAFFPGLASYDTVAYVWQATTDNWITNHSVLYTALVWLSLQISGGIWLLSLAQTVAMAAGLAYAVAGLRKLGVSGRALAIAGIAVAVLPPAASFVIFVWKDVAFVTVQVFLLGTLARIVVAKRRVPAGRWIRDRQMRNLLLLVFVEFLLLALFRQNGQLMVLVSAAVATLVIAGIRLWMATAGIVAALISVVMNLWIYPAMGVTPAKSELLLAEAYGDIAVAYHERPSQFTPADLAVMTRVAPLSVWSDSANCYTSDTTFTAKGFSRAAANDNAGELFALWLRLVKRMPDEIIDARMCRGSIAWRITAGPDRIGTVLTPLEGSRQLFGFGSRMDGNPYRSAIYSDPLSDSAHKVAVFVRKATDADSFKWILWRGATWCYIGYAAVVLFVVKRREPAVLALVAVALANQLVVMVNNPAQLVRYMMGPIFLGILVLPLMFAGRTVRLGAAPAGEAPRTEGAPSVDGAPRVDGRERTGADPAPARSAMPAPTPAPDDTRPATRPIKV
ncbi:MAG: hypothetical protein IRZ05_12040 [Micromonosporaceae bacterium]|nr:hypothetical protein [Micromonosporaceae bacterium]